ncbi:MAG: AAA family ATPase, partial [Deferribacteraceae bacterium]|nr:AAA family ATPase [Deferribacteraceae bacterium]
MQEYAKPVKRFAYYEGMKILNHPDIRRMLLLTGARRIGKTTIMYQMIERLIQQGVSPKRILYVSLDHPILKLSNINEILQIYRDNVYSNDDVYYFFDEIQYADSWDSWLKTLYDTNKQCRAVATGSASPILVSKASESGVGRWTTLSIPTLSFYEYCVLLKHDLPELAADIKPTNLRAMPINEQRGIFQSLRPLLPHFSRYLLVGGFPELALSKDEAYAQRILRDDIVDKVLKRDIPALYNIRSIVDLEKIFIYLCFHS